MTSDTSWRGLQGALGGLSLLDRRQRVAFATAGVLVLGATALDLASVAFTYVIIRALVDPASAAKLPLITVLYHHGLLGAVRWLPVFVSVYFFVFIILKSAYGIALTWYQERLFARVASALGVSLLASYLQAPWNTMALRKTAEMTNVADVAGGPTLTSMLRAYLTLASELSVLVAVLGLLLWIAPWPTLLAIVLLGSIFAVVQRSVRSRIEELGRVCTALANERLQFFQQCIESGREIRISTRIPWFVARFAELRVREAKALQAIMSLQSIPRYLAEPVLFGAMTILIFFIVAGSAESTVTLPTLGIFAVAGFRLMPVFSRSLAAGATLLGFAHPVSVLRGDLALPQEPSAAAGAGIQLAHEIDVRAVSFRYPGRDEAALSNVSFSLAKGEAVAIVGASGAGKSTLADIVVGLRRPDAGSVAADGVDVGSDLERWRAAIGYVPQVVSLFDTGLRENVAFGVDAAQINDDRVRHVLSLVQLDPLLAKLGGSLDSRIGERGTSVSVGERQRIGIARALYDDRKILVMDEATAALDSNTEDLLGNAIEALMGQCTVLVVAHRLATIRRCHSVVVLEGGRIVDRGGYDELLARSPEFARLVRLGAFGMDALEGV